MVTQTEVDLALVNDELSRHVWDVTAQTNIQLDICNVLCTGVRFTKGEDYTVLIKILPTIHDKVVIAHIADADIPARCMQADFDQENGWAKFHNVRSSRIIMQFKPV